MNTYGLTDDQKDIRALAARFPDEVVAPQAMQWDREHRFPKEIVQQLGELGLMGVCVPQSLGGAGADYMTYVLVIEELSRGDAGLGVTLAVHTGAGTLPIIARGARQQIDRLRPPPPPGPEPPALAPAGAGAGAGAGAA